MASSTSSLLQDEDDEFAGSDGEETERLSAMITAGMTMNRRRIFVTSTAILGLGPWNAEVGDLVAVLFGCKFPVVLREV